MEHCELTSNDQVSSGTPLYKVVDLQLNWEMATISIELVGDNGLRKTAKYSGLTATNLIKALNKSDLSIKSLHRRILERLIADGVLSGTVKGTVD